MIPPMNRDWYEVSPVQLETIVVEFLRELGRPLQSFSVDHLGKVAGPDGEFVLDGVARFCAFGADFTVLVECKHHRRRVERGLVQELSDKVTSVRAQKGIMFSTGGYQDGAIEYARSRSIALVHLTPGGPMYESRSTDGPAGPCRDHELWVVYWRSEGGWCYSGDAADVSREWWQGVEQSLTADSR